MIIKNADSWSSHCGSAVMNPTRIHEDVGLIPGIAQWVEDRCCHELWCRLQMQLESGVAMAVCVATDPI